MFFFILSISRNLFDFIKMKNTVKYCKSVQSQNIQTKELTEK